MVDWEPLAAIVADISQLYQLSREQRLDLLLVDGDRHDLTRSVATRLRRANGLTDIWQVVSDDVIVGPPEEYYDGVLSGESDVEEMRSRLRQILNDKRLLESYGLVGRSSAMKALARTISRIAPTEVSVLIVGPSGSGKELVARALHRDSARKDHQFVAINCGALAEGVLESELFGHEKGAFTGSVGKREGLFHKAEGGTIFLDEIGETKPDTQVKLLRVLEDGTYYPVGSSTPQRANVRVVAATNRDLTEAIADRTFREDLYYRISAVKLVVPSLLERKGDIQPLLQFFWRESQGLDYSDAALMRLMQYDWPGNVRQLRNFAYRMIALKPRGLVEKDDIEKFLTEQHASATHLPVSTGRTPEEAGQELIYRAILSLGNEIRMLRNLITSHLPGGGAQSTGEPVQGFTIDVGSTMDEMEATLIQQVLKETGGNRKETAKWLGIGERTLYRKLSKYNLR